MEDNQPEKSTKMATDWVGQCLRKKRLSMDGAAGIVRKARHNGQQLYDYWCPHCGHYHVTKTPQTKDGKPIKKNFNQ